jgi:predicted metal-dependent HD superfamily phosphohydrolase
MNWPEPERWRRLWHAIGGRGDATLWYETLTRAYAEPHRHYHNQQHIADCLAEFDAVRHQAKQPDAVELALWFHDAVYDPKVTDNEEQSATLAKRCLESAGRRDLGETVAALVMATKLHNTDAGSDIALMVDVDLSILGQDDERFAEYETGIRAEYSWVTQNVFNTKRAEILQRFLNRERIYSTDHFFAKYERRARRNLGSSIRKLTR